MIYLSLIIGAMFASSTNGLETKLRDINIVEHATKLKPHQNKQDVWHGVTAHDLFDQFGEDWSGGSTLPDGSHNPNEIKGWGSASASAWTQPSAPQTHDEPAAGGQPMQQMPMQQPGGYQQQPSYGYSGYGATQSTGYQQPGYTSSGFGYSAPSTGYSQTGYSQTGYYDPSQAQQSTGYYDPSQGYSSTGFGYSAPSTGYSTAYDPSQVQQQPQMPGGQQPMGAPPGASMGMGMGTAMPGAKGGMMPGAKGGIEGQSGAVSGKCPLPHRHRKPWFMLTTEQKEMFIEGFQQIRKNGKLDVIAQTHAQHDIQNYVHYTSIYAFYHSYLVWELESAIRDLGGKFACFTMPYYDWTLDAGKEDDPSILKSGIGGDGDPDNNYCVTDDDTGFSWKTCSDYSAWRDVEALQGEDSQTDQDGDQTDDEEGEKSLGDISYTTYDDDVMRAGKSKTSSSKSKKSAKSFLKAAYIDYGHAYDEFTPDDDEQKVDDPNAPLDVGAVASDPNNPFAADPLAANPEFENDEFIGEDIELEAESIEEQCFWTQANCKSDEDAPFCCLKRKKSKTALLPTSAEIGDAMYRAKNIKEWQGYLNEWQNQVMALYGADYYAHLANGYASEDPLFWLSSSFVVHLFSLWQDCWNYNNIPKDKLDMHYNSYHPYCGTFDAQPDNCPAYNLGLDAPMNFYEMQKTDWTLVSHKIITVRKMWTPDFWNVVYELGPFYTTSGINNWCDNTRDSEWFITTMDYDADHVNTELNQFGNQLRTAMYKDNVEQSGIYKTVAALSCEYSRKYSSNSCWSQELEDTRIEQETCDEEEIDNDALIEQTLEDFNDMEVVSDNKCLQRIRRETFPFADFSIQVKKQLCKGDWDYKCPEYNDLLYGQYASFLDSPVSDAAHGKNNGFFANSGWIWLVVINAVLVTVVSIGCIIWRCSRSRKNANNKTEIDQQHGDITVDDEDDDDDNNDHQRIKDTNQYDTIPSTQETEEYQPLLV